MWIDGICKRCGCLVIETGSSKNYDYMNSCTNPACMNFGWHHNFDTEVQSYYKHKDEKTPLVKDIE